MNGPRVEHVFVSATALIECIGEQVLRGPRGIFYGVPAHEFDYPDFGTHAADLFGHRFPFECRGVHALVDEVKRRRMLVPNVLLMLPDDDALTRLIKTLTRLYVASVVDAISADYKRLMQSQRLSGHDLARHRQQIGHYLCRFEDALQLLKEEANQLSVRGLEHSPEGELLSAFIAGLYEAKHELITANLYKQNGQITALNVRTDFTPEQWLAALADAVNAALGHEQQEARLTLGMEGDPTGGYTLKIVSRRVSSPSGTCEG